MVKSSKVMVDVDNNSMMYLPLDKLAKQLPPSAIEEAAERPSVRDVEPIKPMLRREAR